MALTNTSALSWKFARTAGTVLSMVVEIEGGLPFRRDLHSYSYCDIRRLPLFPDRLRFTELLCAAWDASSLAGSDHPPPAHDLSSLSVAEAAEFAALRAACWAP